MTQAEWLPVVFIGLMGLSVLVYSILDGYDLGVGILLPVGEGCEEHRDTMIASIGPFWDANETWLVLSVGLLLIAFPAAHSLILTELYLPATMMLIGLILRGVAFDFRAKAAVSYKQSWDYIFKFGSILTALAQGYMLGRYVTGFNESSAALGFAVLSALGVAAAYAFIGAAWLIMKTENGLQVKAIQWAKIMGRFMFVGVVAVSLVNIEINPAVFDKWFDFPRVMFVLLIPLICFTAFLVNDAFLRISTQVAEKLCWLPFGFAVLIFLTCFVGLSFSYFPEIIPGEMTIWEASSAPESLMFILVGAVIVVPAILAYTIFSYRVFHGKATELRYY